MDNADSVILDNALDPAWQAAFVPWAAAQGFDSISQFAGKVWVAYDPQSYADVPYVTNVLMPLLAPPGSALPNTISGASWAASAQHTVSFQGAVSTSGTVRLGP